MKKHKHYKSVNNRKPRTVRRECQICCESCSESSFLRITANCDHKPIVCNLCINKHISTQLNAGTEITCPHAECRQRLQHDDVKRLASEEIFERFDTLSVRQALNQMQDFRWCKNSGCGSGQIHFEGDSAPIMTCEACGGKSCYTHDVPWHRDLTCSEYDIHRRGNDEATQDLLERETKSCPNCGVRITKNGGCNHMTCKVSTCNYEFCWLCLADYNEIRRRGNRAHKKTCQLYA